MDPGAIPSLTVRMQRLMPRTAMGTVVLPLLPMRTRLRLPRLQTSPPASSAWFISCGAIAEPATEYNAANVLRTCNVNVARLSSVLTAQAHTTTRAEIVATTMGVAIRTMIQLHLKATRRLVTRTRGRHRERVHRRLVTRTREREKEFGTIPSSTGRMGCRGRYPA